MDEQHLILKWLNFVLENLAHRSYLYDGAASLKQDCDEVQSLIEYIKNNFNICIKCKQEYAVRPNQHPDYWCPTCEPEDNECPTCKTTNK